MSHLTAEFRHGQTFHGLKRKAMNIFNRCLGREKSGCWGTTVVDAGKGVLFENSRELFFANSSSHSVP
jgi:hypothetical protein